MHVSDGWGRKEQPLSRFRQYFLRTWFRSPNSSDEHDLGLAKPCLSEGYQEWFVLYGAIRNSDDLLKIGLYLGTYLYKYIFFNYGNR